MPQECVSSRAAQTARDLPVAITITQAKSRRRHDVDAQHFAEAVERLRGPSARYASLGMTTINYVVSSLNTAKNRSICGFVPMVTRR